jgi:single-strand DNA-binding protein
MKANNFVMLRGHLGADPEMKTVLGGHIVVDLRLATNVVWNTESGERRERTDWHRISVWGRLAEFCAGALKRGDQVQVLGSVRNDVVEKPDGEKKTYSSVRASEVVAVRMRGQEVGGGQYSKDANGTAGATRESRPANSNGVGLPSAEIPF